MVFGRTIQQVLIRAQFFFVCIFLLSGCAPVPQKKAFVSPEKSIQKQPEDRGLTILQKMRTQAVSRRVGRWAVVVGISDYKYDTRKDPLKGIPDLRYASRDATAFADFLKSPAGGAFAPDHVMLLTDRKATVKQIRKGIGDFLAQSLEDDLVIIFFAGHGTPDPTNPNNLYLLAYDTEPGNYYGTALPMWEFDIALNRTIHSKRVFLFVDACRSAGVGGTRAKSVSESFNKYMAKLAASKEGITKITASRSDELSLEKKFPEGGHGLFTYYLLKGLKGEADDNSDGFVTMKEAYDYLYDRVRSESRHSQNPWASAYVSDDIPLGISDSQVLSAIRDRVDSQTDQVTAISKPYQPPAPTFDLPKDSNIAVKLAQAKLAKDKPEAALEMAERVIARNDASKPDALGLKIAILLREGDLNGAEDTEDLLVIPYPENPSARTGARFVYDYYLKKIEGLDPGEQISNMEIYLKRHPGRLLEKEAREKLAEIKVGVRVRYEKAFNESLIMAQGFINENRFERARKDLDKAQELAREAFSTYGISIETRKIADLRLQAEREEVTYLKDMFHTYMIKSEKQFKLGDYAGAHASLSKAKEYAVSNQLQEIKDLAKRYNAPPEVKIVLKKDTIDWETPVQFTFEASDKENDPVSVVSWDFGDGTTAKGEKPVHTYAKWTGDQKERKYSVTLKVTDNHSVVKTKKIVTVKKQDRIKTFTVGGVTFKMTRIPAGSFMMGSPSNEPGRYGDEGPQHRVTLTKDFWMGETEVTQGLWQAVMGTNPSHFENCGDDCPVESVSWNDVQRFIQKLNRMVSGSNFRLPTEAEWEYAARAGSTSKFSFGNDTGKLGQFAWYTSNSGSKTHLVTQKKPNAWGLYDMHGNVREWCQDWYGDYPSINVTDPDGPSAGADRVIRGGSWISIPRRVRSANRLRDTPVYRYFYLGFRLARDN